MNTRTRRSSLFSFCFAFVSSNVGSFSSSSSSSSCSQMLSLIPFRCCSHLSSFFTLFLAVIAGLCERVALLLRRQLQQKRRSNSTTTQETTTTTTQQPTTSTKGCTCSETLNTVQIQYKYATYFSHGKKIKLKKILKYGCCT
jgi:hypothetical protein